MALDKQIDFSGGLNTRIPAHKLPANMVQSATNVDFSHGDIRSDIGVGGDGGGKTYYYEKGNSWVSTDGIGGTTSYPITVIEAGTSSSATSDTDLGNPLLIKESGTYQVGILFTFTVNTTTEVLTANATHGIADNSTVQVSSTGLLPKGISFTFTVVASTDVITTNSAHGLSVGDEIRVSSTTTLPTGLSASTTYFVETVPSTTTLTLSSISGGATLDITNTGSGTHSLWPTNRSYYVISASGADLKLSLALGGSAIDIIDAGSGTHNIWATSGTVANSVTINDTQQGLGSVTSFVEYNDDLYMGRDYFQISVNTTNNSAVVTVAAADIPKLIVSDSISGAGIAKESVIDIISVGTNQITLNKNCTATATGTLASINTTPIRLIDGILNKVYPIEIGKPDPFSETVTQIDETNSERVEGHSVMWYTANFPIPFQWGIARFDDATGGESGMSDLTPITLSQANISPDSAGGSRGVNVPVLAKFKINKVDANTDFYGKFALYRVGGTSSVIKKVQDVYLTAQEDGTPLSVTVERDSGTTTEVNVQVNGLPTGAEWKVKWYGYGGTGARRNYTSKGITSITIDGGATNSGYTSSPTVTIAAPGGTGKTATAEAIVTSGAVTNIIITDKGSGYESVPTVTFTGNIGTDVTAVVETAQYQGETTLLTTTSAIKLYGGNASHNIDLHFMVKFTSDAINTITGAPYSDDTREYLFASSNISGTTVSGDNGLASHDGCGSFLDFTPPRALIEIEPIQDPTTIPYNLQYLTEFNNFFVGAIEKRLHVSNYGKPNNYAIDGYVDFEAQITGIGTRGGEAVVFTEYGAHRVYGNAHNEMRKVKVPTVEGVPMGMHRAIANIRDSIIYVSHSGICMFDGKGVTVLTESLLQDFSAPSATPIENVAGVVNDIYYLLTSGGIGWKVDMRFGAPKISKSTNNATNMHFRALANRLYTEAGYIGGASIPNKFTFETRDFTGGDITAEKAYTTVYVTGSDFSGTINIKCDGTLMDTYNYPTPQAEFNRALSISTAKVANRASIEFVNCTGKVQSISVKYDMLAEQTKRRFNAITLTYIGTPAVIVKVDSVEKIPLTTLTDPGAGNTGTSVLYFPAMTEGHLPHLITTETETSRISGSVFDAEAI